MGIAPEPAELVQVVPNETPEEVLGGTRRPGPQKDVDQPRAQTADTHSEFSKKISAWLEVAGKSKKRYIIYRSNAEVRLRLTPAKL